MAAPPHTPWEIAAYAGRVIANHPGADRVTIEVLLCDSTGETLRLLASGFAIDDAVAAAEKHAARRFGSDYAVCDWRAT